MENQLESHQWEGIVRRNWALADRILACAQDIRYANKPADLHFPIHCLIDFAHKTREEQYEWLEKLMKLNPKDRGRWPKL